LSCAKTTCHPRAESAEVHASFVCCLQPKTKLLIDGNFQDSKADKWVNVTNPVREATFEADHRSLSALAYVQYTGNTGH
jgi:hypothetical protein